jgi:predicted transcriptional regulator
MGKDTKTIRVTTRIEPELRDRLEKTAKREDRPLSSIVRLAVIEYIERSEKDKK